MFQFECLEIRGILSSVANIHLDHRQLCGNVKSARLPKIHDGEVFIILQERNWTKCLLDTCMEVPMRHGPFFFFDWTIFLIEKHQKIKEISITSAKLSDQY